MKMLQTIVSVVPFVLSPTAALSSFFCSMALRHSLAGHSAFCPHEGLLSINLHFFSFMFFPHVIGFHAHRLARTVCSQIRCKVLSDCWDVAVNSIYAERLGFSYNVYIQVHLKDLEYYIKVNFIPHFNLKLA